MAVFADDGEKFGVWPETKLNVFDRGWLRQLFDMLAANESWIKMVTPSEVIDYVPPVGKVYLPEGSYREMTEWVLPPDQLAEYEQARRELEPDPRWPRIARFVRGGFWRNFKVRYPETNEMYCADDDGQPAACRIWSIRASMASCSRRPDRALSRPVQLQPIGMARSAAHICRTCATRSTTT